MYLVRHTGPSMNRDPFIASLKCLTQRETTLINKFERPNYKSWYRLKSGAHQSVIFDPMLMMGFSVTSILSIHIAQYTEKITHLFYIGRNMTVPLNCSVLLLQYFPTHLFLLTRRVRIKKRLKTAPSVPLILTAVQCITKVCKHKCIEGVQ